MGYNENEIKLCSNCGYDKFYTDVTDRVDFIICEYNIVCKACDNIVNRYAYGHFENDMIKYRKEMRKLKLKNL